MENKKRLTMPKLDLARVQIVEFGKILFNLQIVAALIVASPLPFVIYPLYYAALILLSLFSGFTIYAIYPGFASLWAPVQIVNVMTALVESWRITIPIVIGISLLSMLCLCFDKNTKHKKRIIASFIVIALVIAYLIFRLSIVANGGAA